MQCIEISQPGGPEVLRLVERERPVPGAGEVLIRVAAAGVNRPDCLQRAGRYPPPPGASDIPGLEVAGVVEALGDGVTRWSVGQKACALVTGGGYAEYCVASADVCLPLPADMGFQEAAALPEALFTVWSNVFMRGGLKAGETLLVQGGASGIGTMAIQLAHALGHEVYATAGSPEKCRLCESLGARRAINYRMEDFEDVVRKMTAGRGVDVILDMVGGEYVSREFRIMAEEGRLVMIAFLGGARAALDIPEIMRRRLTVTGSTLRPRPLDYKAEIAHILHQKVWPLIETRQVRPVIHAAFSLADAVRAHALMESGQHSGKIILTC